MKDRCERTTTKSYANYGGRGITVCARWQDSFEAFLADMGEKPAGMSIDRIDVNGNYEPGNCRWATRKQQNRNTRFNKLTEVSVASIRERSSQGESVSALARAFDVSRRMIRNVIQGHAWTP